jgi:iron complex transport system ATP-binding protein
MNSPAEKIISFSELLIGYKSGTNRNILLPPLNAFARKGELIAVIGENGVGKSTLLRTITGLQEQLGGKVYIGDKSLDEFPRYALAKKIGYISTEPVRVSNMKVYDLVSLGRYPHTNWIGKLDEADHVMISDAIDKVGLRPLLGRFINELSDGERQRAMIARVLAQDTEILVMDEPTAFLDIRIRYEIVHLLHDLSKTRQKTIIFSTHDLLTAISDADKIWLTLRDSFIDGAPEDLIIDGVFDRLFGDSTVKFNQSDGSFSLKRPMQGNVFVDARGIDRYWTEKAVNRAGFGISADQSEIKVSVTGKGETKKWTATEGEISVEFRSIYELVSWLNTR